MVNGWHSSSARLALSASAGPKAEVELSTTAGSDASEPSALNRTCRTTKRSDETSTPGGGLQHWLKRARKKPLHYRPLEDYLAERKRK